MKRESVITGKLHLQASTFALGKLRTLGKEQLKFLVRFVL